MTKPSSIPQLKLHLAENSSRESYQTGYRLEGWEEFDQWAFNHLPEWRSFTKLADNAYCMSEVDRLRVLAWTYASKLERLQEEYAKYMWENPAPVMGPDGQVWRYIGP